MQSWVTVGWNRAGVLGGRMVVINRMVEMVGKGWYKAQRTEIRPRTVYPIWVKFVLADDIGKKIYWVFWLTQPTNQSQSIENISNLCFSSDFDFMWTSNIGQTRPSGQWYVLMALKRPNASKDIVGKKRKRKKEEKKGREKKEEKKRKRKNIERGINTYM